MNTERFGLDLAVVRFTGKLDQTSRFKIRYNSILPTRYTWYAIHGGEYFGMDEGDWLVVDQNDRIKAVLADYVYQLMNFKDQVNDDKSENPGTHSPD